MKTKPKNENNSSNKSSFGKHLLIGTFLFIGIFICMYVLGEEIDNNWQKTTYVCDNNITDDCMFTRIMDGGVWLTGCEKNSEYFCQSVIEVK